MIEKKKISLYAKNKYFSLNYKDAYINILIKLISDHFFKEEN
jgi:hypothetical protein